MLTFFSSDQRIFFLVHLESFVCLQYFTLTYPSFYELSHKGLTDEVFVRFCELSFQQVHPFQRTFEAPLEWSLCSWYAPDQGASSPVSEFGRLLVVLNIFHFTIMEATGILRTYKSFRNGFILSAHIHVLTRHHFLWRSAKSSLKFMAWFLV